MDKELQSYKQLFNSAVYYANKHCFYLGTGNPNSAILIIGKEAAISMETNKEQYVREIQNNPFDWKQNIEHNIGVDNVSSWFAPETKYNPLYPYKGQLNKVEMRDKGGNVIRGWNGTSKTWFNYQQITDIVFNDGVKSAFINFHEYTFITELNEKTGKYSKDVPEQERLKSIEERSKLLGLPFFNEFPILIVAVGHYVRDFKINLEDMFSVKFDPEESARLSRDLGKDFINIHYNPNNHKRVLIHTNQLSMVSNELISRLAIVCKNHLKQIENE